MVHYGPHTQGIIMNCSIACCPLHHLNNASPLVPLQHLFLTIYNFRVLKVFFNIIELPSVGSPQSSYSLQSW